MRGLQCALLIALGLVATEALATPPELLYVPEGNRLRRYDPDTIDRGLLLAEIVFQNAETDPERGRDLNGMVCAVPGEPGLLIAGEDTGQPSPAALRRFNRDRPFNCDWRAPSAMLSTIGSAASARTSGPAPAV